MGPAAAGLLPSGQMHQVPVVLVAHEF